MGGVFGVNIFVLFASVHMVTCLDNYPNSDKVKLCTPRQTSIDLRAPLCIPTPSGWEAKSSDNCATLLRSQCPEFNEGECLWYEMKLDQSTVGVDCLGGSTQIAACRLRYHASLSGSLSKKTWMEIYYVNQFGTTAHAQTDFYIIEVHRYVNLEAKKFFGNVEQADFPLSVSNSHEAGGYKWSPYSSVFPKNAAHNQPLCTGGQDTGQLCQTTLRDDFIRKIIPRFEFGTRNRYHDTPSSVLASCDRAVTVDPTSNQLTKQDVCKISHKVTRDESTYNYLTCLATRSSPRDEASDGYVHIEYKCYIRIDYS